MKFTVVIGIYLFYFCICNTIIELKFDNTIKAVGFPYYKILMALGHCKEKVLYQDQKAWSKVRLNRIVDIYYRSSDPEMLVSRVEIELVLNDTDCFVTTRTGVGHPQFAGTLFIPTRAAIVLYQLYIYTCSRPKTKHGQSKDKLKQLDSSLHKTTEPFYHPNLFFSSNEESGDQQYRTKGSLINYAPLDDRKPSPEIDALYD